MITGVRCDAELSDCGHYRWWLSRSWDDGDGRSVCFVMLNPSTADAAEDDPTIRRCIGFAKGFGFSQLVVRNLFPYRATKPKSLLTAVDPTGGPRGDEELDAAGESDVIVAAWGAWVPFGRAREFKWNFRARYLWCLGWTKMGHPRHPLYVPGKQELVLL